MPGFSHCMLPLGWMDQSTLKSNLRMHVFPFPLGLHQARETSWLLRHNCALVHTCSRSTILRPRLLNLGHGFLDCCRSGSVANTTALCGTTARCRHTLQAKMARIIVRKPLWCSNNEIFCVRLTPYWSTFAHQLPATMTASGLHSCTSFDATYFMLYLLKDWDCREKGYRERAKRDTFQQVATS